MKKMILKYEGYVKTNMQVDPEMIIDDLKLIRGNI